MDFAKTKTITREDYFVTYKCLEKENYFHETVNYGLHFKHPEKGCDTNHIKSEWLHAKAILPEYNHSKKLYVGYLAIYMFNKTLKDK